MNFSQFPSNNQPILIVKVRTKRKEEEQAPETRKRKAKKHWKQKFLVPRSGTKRKEEEKGTRMEKEDRNKKKFVVSFFKSFSPGWTVDEKTELKAPRIEKCQQTHNNWVIKLAPFATCVVEIW